MSLRHYATLLGDARTVIRTIRRVYGAPRPLEVPPHQRGEAQRVADRVHPPWITVRVDSIRVETPSTRTLVVRATSGSLPPFAPGQYVNVFVEVQGVRTSRPMSISAPSRAKGTMELTIKRKQGGFVSGHLLDELRAGDELQISGPEGDFQYQRVRDGKDLVFIAAGSGVTPFMGMIEDILARRADARVGLLYGSRSADEIIFRDRLLSLAARHPRLRLCVALSAPSVGWDGERGRIDQPMIRRFLDGEGLAGKTFFVCGPTGLERTATRALEELGVGRGRIRVEPCGCLEDVTRQPGWPAAVRPDQRFEVQIEGRAEPIVALAGEPLLSSLERAGITVPVLCRSGRCGACRTRLTHGAVVRAAGPGQRGSESAGGFIHACVSHPVSDLRVEVLPDRRLLAAADHASRAPEASSAAMPAPLPRSVSDGEAVPAAAARLRVSWSKSLLAVAGLGFFLYLVLSSGITPDLLARVGWQGFGLVLLVSMVVALADPTAWLLALRHVARPGFVRLFGLRTGGDALTASLPGGVVLGEGFKALGLRRWLGVSLSDGAASLMTVKFGLGITQSLFVLGGLILIYSRLRDRSTELFGFRGAQYLGLALIAGFLAVLVLLLLAVLRGRSFSTLARGLARLPIARLRRWIRANAGRIAEVDESFAGVYRENRRRLPAIFVVLLAGWVAASVESYVLLRVMGQPVSLQTAIALESVGSMFRLLFFLVPSGIGGQDASQLALFKLFDLPRAAGGAFVLIKRLKELCWIGLGFVLIMVLRKKGEASAPSHTPSHTPAPSVAAVLPASPRVV